MSTPTSPQPESNGDALSRRSSFWQLRTQRLEFGSRPRIMGILNVTPDSFSDGGKFHESGPAVDHALAMIAAGADVIDVGGESTRPYSKPVPVEEELRRVSQVIRTLRRQSDVPISIDTSKADVAEVALGEGAEIVNDVTGLEGDPRMLSVVRQSGAGVCVMHMQGSPQTMQDDPRYDDVVAEIGVYLQQRRDALTSAGIDALKICLDPGIGFGKTHQHNLTLMAHCGAYHALGCPLLVGHSRKGFIGKVLAAANVPGGKDASRTAGTIGAALSLARQGVQVIRVHDVAEVHQALLLFEACGGINGNESVLPSESL